MMNLLVELNCGSSLGDEIDAAFKAAYPALYVRAKERVEKAIAADVKAIGEKKKRKP